jgi:cyclic beta-1,2-glucan synthetase
MPTLTPPAPSLRSPDEPPAPELFSQEQLDAHAESLARAHHLLPGRARGEPLLQRLDENASDLEEAFQALSAAGRDEGQRAGSEDWLRDNHHLVQDQVREIRRDLPKKFYAELPKLSDGALAGYPRVYQIARELVAHTAGRFDLETLADFTIAYQRVAPLSIGETWAIPIMLRIALVEELGRLARGVVAARRSRIQASRWEGLLTARVPHSAEAIHQFLDAERQVNGRLSAPFVAELLQWLRDQPTSAAPAWHALQRALEEQGDTPEEILRREHQREAADQLAIGNVITSMRLLSSIEWPLFFDRVSVVEQVLRGDPAGAYAGMDFPTRDRYRRSVEQLSKRSGHSELDVAQRAVGLAREAAHATSNHDGERHVGYYLISRGRFRLERELKYPPTAVERFARFVFAHPVLGYLSTIAMVMAVTVGGLLEYGARHGATTEGLWLIALVTLVPVSELAISLLNLFVTSVVRPRQLPKLEMRAGIPARDRTMVVVPAIVDSVGRLESLFDDLEVRFFGNRDAHLHFALLSDFADDGQPVAPGDETLVAAALRRVDDLNARHGADRFFLFHRERRWNESEQRWMGWERKRGKLSEFNRLVGGATDTTFTVRHGDLSILRAVRYVITLDSDTQLPIGAARRMVGTLSHPLNRPRFDPNLRRVTEGYGVLQPRVTVSLVSANRTAFAKVFSGHVGLDPYTTAVSDVYQDLFHEGSYVGKGIYDVSAFEAAVSGRVPENTLLSHDLFEGFYARAGLCTDIHLVDDYPSNYLTFAARQHRWVRGDWQIARWLWRTVPDASGRAVRNTLPVIARWKILDNLRRSLLPPALVVLLVAGWTVLPGSAGMWTTLALLVLAFPAYVQVARSLGSAAPGIPLRQHVLAERDNIVTSFRQAFLSIAILAHQSVVMADAIARTLVRLLVTRRHLLEWATADRVERAQGSVASTFRRMWQGPVMAGASAVVIVLTAPGRLALALPILVLWFASPALAHAGGLRLPHLRASLSREERRAFRKIARATWLFFEELVVAADNWLAPDNYQEGRRELVAHRTSPTNIGLQLLSTLAAYDFGYLGMTGTLDRVERTVNTLLRMPRYRGHFYNWYDTRSLAPLAPAYISTVDSGNLAGYLITLRAGLTRVVSGNPLVEQSALEGLKDVLSLCEDEVLHIGDARIARTLKRELRSTRALLVTPPVTRTDWRDLFALVADRLSTLSTLVHEAEEPLLGGEPTDDTSERLASIGSWIERGAAAIASHAAELSTLTEWMDRADGRHQTLPPDVVPTLPELIEWCDRALTALPPRGAQVGLRAAVERCREHAEALIDRADRLGALADDLVEETEFGFLFNPDRQLFAIGFNVSEGRQDSSYYDLLASEARLASFVAIATGKISHDHWFKLDRPLAPIGVTSRALLSWSASMFEYLMPWLVMRVYPGTLLDETYRAVVARQIQYAQERDIPWGISESAYYAQDLEGNYQYRAFGIPGLGLRRGLGDDLVVAPYATLLAAPLVPSEVLRNLERMRAEGATGRYGYYDAIDYTPDRIPRGRAGTGFPLPTYLAHHQGMTLLSLDNLLNGSPMQDRFHSDPRVQAAELLLQERIPQLVPLKTPPVEQAEHALSTRRAPAPPARHYITPHTLTPRAHLLSNGSYTVMATNAGGGFSRRQNLALTRWREDMTRDHWGSFCYVRDLESGEFWSTTHQPTLRAADEYEVTFAPDRAVWRRVDGDLELRTELVVSPEDDLELRRVSVTNHGARVRTVELTSYAEVVLAPPDADLAHPVFSNLFVETFPVPDRDALVCARRPRAGGDRVYLVHALSGGGRVGAATQYETDRARFIGRGRTLDHPAALDAGARLSNTTGPVLDPIVSLRRSIRLPPGGTARVSFATGFADSEEGAHRLLEKYHDRRAVARALALASTHGEVERRHLGFTIDDTLHFLRLGSRLLYGDPRLRSSDAVRRNRLGQLGLWKHGISGDLPILLARLSDGEQLPLFRELLKAHEYLRAKGLPFDLVVLNEYGTSYLQELQDSLQQLVESGPEQAWINRAGGVFLRRADLMDPEEQMLLRAAARVDMDGAHGQLREQLARPQVPFEMLPPRAPRSDSQRVSTADPRPALPPPGEDLEFFNGVGGFGADGREYVIRVHQNAGILPPAPWANVVARPAFGFVSSDLGTGFTWSGNSHDNRLTPWHNDPVGDPPGEAIFIRNDETGGCWSATPLPAGDGEPYTVRHGLGYSTWEHQRDGIHSTLRAFVPEEDPVKLFHLTVRNTSSRRRSCTITLYVDWVLGENRARSALHIVTGREPATGALVARNAFREAFADRLAFVDLSGDDRTITGDRTEFIGRNGTLRRPAAMAGAPLSDRTGAMLDACGAVQVRLHLAPLEERAVVGMLGEAADLAGVRRMVEHYRDPGTAKAALDRVVAAWDRTLDAVTLRTPDRSLDLMLNRWLLYQTLACRVWGRSAVYQSSGAFGFRDQLQDVLALLHAAPRLVREHILRAAARQFVEGDVQHWWHEPGGQGVRARFSDDRLWLVFATLEYVAATGDVAVLDEEVPFVQGRPLNAAEQEVYERPSVSAWRASLFEHCVRAIEVSLPTGVHGLPLIGTGDWNDGMNLVGSEGRGESVWLGWFLVSILGPFADLAARRGEHDRADGYRRHAAQLTGALARAWDGAWYRRAYFDDGTPLGSAENEECRIDAIAQSWAVISGGSPEARARQAMASADEHLVRREDGLVLLLTPPFERMVPSPGYIQGYVPGVRENGGQYTHAALWTVLAFAKMGDGDRAMELLSLLNPVNHAQTAGQLARYRVEPYVVAADVYSRPPHTGRGGWTWYTGSAAWMYRVGVEALLGITLRGGALRIDPCIPRHWPRYEVVIKRGASEYRIAVENPNGVNRGVRAITLDAAEQTAGVIALVDDGRVHEVRVVLGSTNVTT